MVWVWGLHSLRGRLLLRLVGTGMVGWEEGREGGREVRRWCLWRWGWKEGMGVGG